MRALRRYLGGQRAFTSKLSNGLDGIKEAPEQTGASLLSDSVRTERT